jgi:hypothetical protein
MNRTVSQCVVLIVGVGLGFGLSLSVRLYQKKQSEYRVNRIIIGQRQAETAERWRVEAAAAADAYYGRTIPVPLPPNLDFSTNTWQKLNYWSRFARYFLWYQSPQAPHRVSLIAYGPNPDPWESVICFEERLDGPSGLAMDAVQKLRKGESFNDVRNWVGEHAKYADASTFRSYSEAITNNMISP